MLALPSQTVGLRGLRRNKSLCIPKCGTRDSARRRYSKKSDAEDETEQSNYERIEQERLRSGMPGKYRTRTQDSQRNRAALSILSPLNRTAPTLGSQAVILFAGASAKKERYASWPRVSTCPLIPKGGYLPLVKAFNITGNPTEDIANIKDMVVKKIRGTDKKTSLTAGKVKWFVGVGDAIQPLQPLLRIGDCTFFAQPKLKPPSENPPLYVAKLLLEDGQTVYSVKRGEPLLVAVHDLDQLVRFEHFVPTADLISKLY